MITESDMLRVRGVVDKANNVGARIGGAVRWSFATPLRVIIIVALVSFFGLAAICQGMCGAMTRSARTQRRGK